MIALAIALIVSAAGCGEVIEGEDPIPGDRITDDSFDGFAAGTFLETEWAGDHVQLAADEVSGEYLSQIIDAGSEGAKLAALSWLTREPHGKPLPGDGARESGYSAGNIDMTDNVLLLRLDEPDAMGDGQTLADASGRGNHAVVASADDVLRPEIGLFDGALNDSVATHAFVDLEKTRDFDFGTGDFTWALWSRSTQDCTGNKVYMGGDGEGLERVHLWLGCADSEANSACSARPGEPGGRAAGFFRATHNLGGDGAGFCGTTRINDGQWHHLAIVKSGHSPTSTLTLYVDGKVEMTLDDVTFDKELTFLDRPNFTFGEFTTGDGRYQAAASFDEIAVWRRALSGDEIAGLHRRGALRLRFQVRVCSDPSCATPSSFLGPKLDPNAFFIDRAGPRSDGEISNAVDDTSGRYFQYRALFDSDIPGASAFLDAVTLTLER